jgi:hypothetical protein
VVPDVKLHLGRYRRYLWQEPSLLVVVGEFPQLALGKKLYEERFGIEPATGTASGELEQIMGAAALAALSRTERASWGWTITLPGSGHGFFCGVEPEGMVCGRVRPASEEKAAVYLQRQQPEGLLIESHYEPLSSDPLRALSRYFEQVEQIPTRIVLDEGHSGVLVQELPGGDFSRVEGLPEDRLLELLRRMADQGELQHLHEAVLFYECRCDDEMILGMISSLSEAQRKEVWGSESSLTVECPRCGREYTILRSPQLD